MEMALVRFINFFKKAHNFVVFSFPRQQVWIVKSSFSTVGFRRESPVNQIEPDEALRTPLTPTVFAFPAWLWIDFFDNLDSAWPQLVWENKISIYNYWM